MNKQTDWELRVIARASVIRTKMEDFDYEYGSED